MVDVYRQKLRSVTTAQRKPSLPERKTPSFLRIVASPDDDEAEHLAAELNLTAISKWAVVRDYIGSAADIITTKQNIYRYITENDEKPSSCFGILTTGPFDPVVFNVDSKSPLTQTTPK